MNYKGTSQRRIYYHGMNKIENKKKLKDGVGIK